MVRAVKSLKARLEPETTFFCLSNANSVFISTILEVSSYRLIHGQTGDHHEYAIVEGPSEPF